MNGVVCGASKVGMEDGMPPEMELSTEVCVY
jgi:hypothetical protein